MDVINIFLLNCALAAVAPLLSFNFHKLTLAKNRNVHKVWQNRKKINYKMSVFSQAKMFNAILTLLLL